MIVLRVKTVLAVDAIFVITGDRNTAWLLLPRFKSEALMRPFGIGNMDAECAICSVSLIMDLSHSFNDTYILNVKIIIILTPCLKLCFWPMAASSKKNAPQK